MKKTAACTAFLLVLAGGLQTTIAQDNAMSFFLTSAGPGNGANLGGLDGADAHCQSLAVAAGSSGKTWHAYLCLLYTSDAADE